MAKNKSRMMGGTSLLKGNNNIPGIRMHKEVAAVLPEIEAACRKMGLNYPPIIVEFVSYDEMAELAAYGGFPERYPHWRFGGEWEQLNRGYEHNQYRISEMVINCLHLDAPVLTDKGTIPAKEVHAGMYVYANNSWRKVMLTKLQPVGPVLSIKLDKVIFDVQCSLDHKWYILRDNKFLWMEAKNIKEGDFLVGNKEKPSGHYYSVPLNSPIDGMPREMTLELAELLGLLMSGNVACVQGKSVITGEDQLEVCTESDIIFKIKLLVDKIFDCNLVKNCIYFGEKYLSFNNQFKNFFEYIGLNQREIPWVVLGSDLDRGTSFLRNLFSSHGVVVFKDDKKYLIGQIQQLLLQIGIESRISTCGDYYAINIEGRWLRKFFDKKSFVIDELNDFCKKTGINNDSCSDIGWILENLGTPLIPVKSVIKVEDQPTIDIALEGDKHDFTAYGFITHNTSPAVIYCMDSNTLVDNVDVIAHAIGHADLFNNNVFFEKTNKNMINKLANHGQRIRKYMATWGYETVTEFIDNCLRVETLIDLSSAWRPKKQKEYIVKDKREYKFPERLKANKNYMEEWVNTQEYLNKQKEKIEKEEAAEYLGLFKGKHKDIFGYLRDHAPLKPWQQDVISMLHDESMYFSVQRITKTINEGMASFTDHVIMCEYGLAALGQPTPDSGIWHYAEHKMRVLGGKYSQNPYKLGFELFMDIRDRWNKGRFGPEWESCTDLREKEKWDKNFNLGMEKILEVRRIHNDYTLIKEFFTPEFCEKNKFFEYKKFPNGEWKIVNRDFKSIKEKLLRKHLNGGLPDIRLEDPNHLGKGWFLLEHQWDGRPLYDPYARETLTALHYLWKNVIVLTTKSTFGKEYVYVCNGPSSEKDVELVTRDEYESEFLT